MKKFGTALDCQLRKTVAPLKYGFLGLLATCCATSAFGASSPVGFRVVDEDTVEFSFNDLDFSDFDTPADSENQIFFDVNISTNKGLSAEYESHSLDIEEDLGLDMRPSQALDLVNNLSPYGTVFRMYFSCGPGAYPAGCSGDQVESSLIDVGTLNGTLTVNFAAAHGITNEGLTARWGLSATSNPGTYLGETGAGVSAVPLPASAPLLLSVIGGLAWFNRRRKQLT